MKKLIALAMVLVLTIGCISSAMADTFSDLYGDIAYYEAVLEKSTDEFRIMPTDEAMTEYAVNGLTILPAMSYGDGVPLMYLVLKGIEENENPYNIQIMTDSKVYSFVNKFPDDPKMNKLTVGKSQYNIIMLDVENADLISEIANSETVEVRFSTNGQYFNVDLAPGVKNLAVHTFEVTDEVKKIFAAVSTAIEKVLSSPAMDDPTVAFTMKFFVAQRNLELTVEERTHTSMWD